MTSNLGAAKIQTNSSLGFRQQGDTVETRAAASYELMKEKVQTELKTNFRPEFLNRIDATVGFRTLTVEELTKMKRQPGKTITIVGSPTLMRSLLRDGLVDRLDVLVFPIVVGSGKRLFEEGIGELPLDLVDSRTFKTGVVSLALLIPTALAAPFAGPLIDHFGASRVLLGAYGAQAVAMGATAASLLSGAPPVVSYALGALTAMGLVMTHPAHAVVSPGIARTTEQLVALNAVTGWILSIGLVLAPACAGLILAVSTPGAVYAAGAACVVLAAILVVPLRDLVERAVAQ